MEVLAHPICAVLLGVALSLIYILLSTENPAKIPLSKVFFRALFGMLLYVVTWIIFSYPFYRIILKTYSWVGSLDKIGIFCLACGVGLFVPLAVRAGKNNLLDRSAARKYRLLITVLQYIDEVTGQYFGRIIFREERKASQQVMEPDEARATLAIDRLFELHIEEIECDQAQELKPAEREKVANFVKIRSTATKFKFLLRHLGYEDCMASIQKVKETPGCILEKWPVETGQRRNGHDRRQVGAPHSPERRMLPYGRRKLDSPDVRDIILGKSKKALTTRAVKGLQPPRTS